jgi:hypothetical protein
VEALGFDMMETGHGRGSWRSASTLLARHKPSAKMQSVAIEALGDLDAGVAGAVLRIEECR